MHIHFPTERRTAGHYSDKPRGEDDRSENERERDPSKDIFRAAPRQQKSARQTAQRDDDCEESKEVFHVTSYFCAAWTRAATFSRSAFSAMKPVASFWL